MAYIRQLICMAAKVLLPFITYLTAHTMLCCLLYLDSTNCLFSTSVTDSRASVQRLLREPQAHRSAWDTCVWK